MFSQPFSRSIYFLPEPISSKIFKKFLDNDGTVDYIANQPKEAIMNLQGISTIRFNYWGYWYWRQRGHGGICPEAT
jgi:hypothetical protein